MAKWCANLVLKVHPCLCLSFRSLLLFTYFVLKFALSARQLNDSRQKIVVDSQLFAEQHCNVDSVPRKFGGVAVYDLQKPKFIAALYRSEDDPVGDRQKRIGIRTILTLLKLLTMFKNTAAASQFTLPRGRELYNLSRPITLG